MTPGTLAELTRSLRGSEPYARLAGALGAVRRCPVPAAAWLAELLAIDRGRPVLAIVPRDADALAWIEAAELFGRGGAFFPAPALTPYQAVDVSLQVRSQEIVALDQARRGVGVVVTTPRALFRRLPPPDVLAGLTVDLQPGDAMALDALAARLVRVGYQRTELVSEVGDVAVRGGLVDCFPAGAERALRLDFFGDTLESVHEFEVGDQRSLDSVERARLLPLALHSEGAAAALADRLTELGAASAGREASFWVEELRGGAPPPGWQRFLPVLEAAATGLEDHLADPLVLAVAPETLVDEARRHARQLEEEHAARLAAGRITVEPTRLERGLAEVVAILEGAAVTVDGPARQAVDFGSSVTDVFHGQLPRFPRELDTASRRGERVVLVAPEDQHPWLSDWLRGLGGAADRVELVAGELQRGFRLPAAGAAIYGERQLFPRRTTRAKPSSRARAFISGLRDLKVGDFVVHRDHGIGQFLELRSVGRDGGPEVLPPSLADVLGGERSGDTEVMEIAYRGGRRLLLPMARLDLIERYSGLGGGAPILDKLGGSSWSRRKASVKSGMRQLAGDLIRLHAERQLATAPAAPPPGDLYGQFEAAFEHEETPDQDSAVAEILEDLSRSRPMDRLLCGDVGFGKTEVAMRAAFRIVEAGRQVAVLAPTTILADQHHETFRRRFRGFPITVEVISRFRSPTEIREIRKRLGGGEVDILIGTHRLLSRDIELPKLGLLVIDEEQRFGVAQKERLRRLKKNVHVLSMSATPVPRTLQLSLAGVRDLSVIETPPRDRMAVETVVLPFSADLVREAVGYELERGGQVYVVFNRVEGIEEMAGWLRDVLPGIRLTVGHGQLPERELADRIHAFKAGEHDLLLATTIIENGIDISNVNTMLIHRADRFGLAQLYQLRGRVGRGRQLGYCYLTVSPDRALSQDARQRLDAIREFTELGAGFRVAARDLEIRGAGNLLGAEQSGHIAAVGIESYLRMLEETIRELKGEEVEVERGSAVIDLPVAAAIPVEYVTDGNLRMEIYQRIAAGESRPEALLEELADRFGPPPPAVERLVAAATLKGVAERLGIQSISHSKEALNIRLRRDNAIDLDALVRWLGERRDARFSPSGVLTVSGVSGAVSVDTALQVLGELAT